jgi:hypothetical protein
MGKSSIVAVNEAPNIIIKGISTANSSVELINADIVMLKVSTSRGIYILVTRLDFPTIEPIAVVVPICRKRHVMIPISR